MEMKAKVTKITCLAILGGILLVSLITGGFLGIRTYHQRKEIVPPSSEWLFENSDVISYVEVLEVDRRIRAEDLGSIGDFPKQNATVKFLKMLKGPKRLTGETSSIVKGKGYFYLRERQRVILYLRKKLRSYRTISSFEGQWQLASALADVNNLGVEKGSGIVIGLLKRGNPQEVEAHILRGRHKAPIALNSLIYKEQLVKTARFGEFDIAEMPLEPSAYTILVGLGGSLYSFSPLVDGYYPYVILDETDWRGLYFDLESIATSDQ